MCSRSPSLASWGLIDRTRRILPYVNRISGGLLVAVGLYVGHYGLYEVRLFKADGNPDVRVIAAAARLQGALADWVHAHGAWPWILALAVLVLGALTWAGVRSRRSPRGAADQLPL